MVSVYTYRENALTDGALDSSRTLHMLFYPDNIELTSRSRCLAETWVTQVWIYRQVSKPHRLSLVEAIPILM